MKQSRGAAVTRDCIQVCLDGAPQCIGTFYPNHGGHHGTHAFAYSPNWLESLEFFDLDPRLLRCEGEQYVHPSLPMFGALRDAIPDRWGRMLLDRWETVTAGTEKRPIRMQDDVDYLLAVEDATRIGALRFSRSEGSFLKESTFPISTLKDLPSLADISLNIDSPAIEQHSEYSSRLARLVTAAASLGGARPKVSYLDNNQLWIAKFPSLTDEYDVAAWEYLLNQLARKSKIFVPEARLLRLSGPYSSFCVKRFDREGPSRKMYASAMTCLGRHDGDDEASYLDIADFISKHVAKEMVSSELEQLFRRVLFNALVGNRDDHLRNHGFLRSKSGWELAPAFDINPNPMKKEHAVRLDASSAVPDVDTLLATAEVYQLTREKAAAILDEVASVVSTWREEALRLRISRREIQMMREAFA